MAGHSKGEHRVALQEKARRKIRRTLADDAKRNPIFATLFGDAKQRLLGRLKSPLFVARRIAVGFFANYRNRDRGLAPQGEIESEATKDRDHDVQDFRRDSWEVEYGNRLTVYRNTKQLGKNIRKFVTQGQTASEYETITAVILQDYYSILYSLIGVRAAAEPAAAHPRARPPEPARRRAFGR